MVCSHGGVGRGHNLSFVVAEKQKARWGILDWKDGLQMLRGFPISQFTLAYLLFCHIILAFYLSFSACVLVIPFWSAR